MNADRNRKEFTVVTDRRSSGRRATDQRLGVDLHIGQAISEALSRARDSRGGLKNLAEVFDGRDGEPVAVSTISRWMAEPQRFNATFVLILARLDTAFRRQLVAALAMIDQDESPIVDELSEGAKAEYRAALEKRISAMVYGIRAVARGEEFEGGTE